MGIGGMVSRLRGSVAVYELCVVREGGECCRGRGRSRADNYFLDCWADGRIGLEVF